MKSLLWKFFQSLMSFWKAQLSSPSNFAWIFSTIRHNSSVFFRPNIIVFRPNIPLVKRSPEKCTFLRYLSAVVNIHQVVVSVLKWQVNSSSNFVSLFIAMIRNSYVNFKFIYFILWIKGSHESPKFETL